MGWEGDAYLSEGDTDYGKIGVAPPAHQGRIGDWDVVSPAIEFDSGVLKRDGRGGSPEG